MKRWTSVFLAAALCVGTAACGSSQSTAKDVSSKTVSAADSSAAVSKADSSAADSSKADSSAADSSKVDSSAADSSKADSSSTDSSAADSSVTESLAGEDSSSVSADEKTEDDQKEVKSMVFDQDYVVIPWTYEEYVPTYLSTMEEGVVYEAPNCGDMTFLNDTEKDLLVYYESDNGVVGVLPHAAVVLEGLAIEDPVAYIDMDDVVRVRVEEVDPYTLDRKTEGVLFVDEMQKGKKLNIKGVYMLINGGSEDVSIKYKTMEGEPLTVTLTPGCVLGFEWLSVSGGMKVVSASAE